MACSIPEIEPSSDHHQHHDNTLTHSHMKQESVDMFGRRAVIAKAERMAHSLTTLA